MIHLVKTNFIKFFQGKDIQQDKNIDKVIFSIQVHLTQIKTKSDQTKETSSWKPFVEESVEFFRRNLKLKEFKKMREANNSFYETVEPSLEAYVMSSTKLQMKINFSINILYQSYQTSTLWSKSSC